MKRTPHDWSYRRSEVHSDIETKGKNSGEPYYDGVVSTPLGFVLVYSQGHGGRYEPASRYSVFHAGRFWMRTENVARTPRGLAIMAHRFARQVIAGEVQP